jgi:hypothetical protein
MTPRYMVRGQLKPQHPAYLKTEQFVSQVSLIGNGQAMSGQLALQALSQLTKGGGK